MTESHAPDLTNPAMRPELQGMDAAPLLIVGANRNLDIDFVNGACCSYYGLPSEEFVGLALRDFFGGEHAQQVCQSAEATLSGEEATLELCARFPAAGSRHVRIAFLPRFDEEREVLGLYVIIIDLTAEQSLYESLEERLSFERFIAEVSSRLISGDSTEIHHEISRAAAAIGEFLNSDRCYIFLLSADGSHHRVAHVWTREGVAFDQEVVDVPVQETFPWLGAKMMRHEDIIVPRLDELPAEANLEREYCRDRGIKSFLMCPMCCRELVMGNIGLDMIRQVRDWTVEDARRLRLLGDILGNGLLRERKDREIRELKARLEAENVYLREEIKLKHSYKEIVGQSDVIKSVLSQAEQVAPTMASVLLLGETGTGKELLARAIHSQSPRRERPMIVANCAALTPTLIESELFGREKGAYTGAHAKQVGRFELADHSTIFLDEIGELPLELQAKLLRVLQTGEFERLGSSRTLQVDVRVIAATNRDLAQAVRAGTFREDLYYRLNVFPITVPPLRTRREDIPILVWAFVEEFSKRIGQPIDTVPRRTMEALQRYPWPGNIRELRNVIERAVILNRDGVLRVTLPEVDDPRELGVTLEEIERRHILRVLEHTGWRVKGRGGAAELLGMKPTTLQSRMSKLGIERPKL